MTVSVTDRVRAVLRLALWTVPIPFGAFASDKGLFVSLSVLVFILASLSLPITVRRRQMKGTGTSQYASVSAILYGGIVALCVAVAILNGLMAYPFWQEYALRVAAFFVWMLGTLTLQSLAAWGVDWWLKRRRAYWFSEFLDAILYSLPLPCAVMGMLLFPAISDGEVTTSLVVGVMGIMGFGFIAMGICVIAVFAFYFFPSKGLPGKERIIQGQQQRVLLARALNATSKLLLLDEPVAGLDPVATGEMYNILKLINLCDGVTVVMVSHDVNAAMRYATHILQLGHTQLYFGSVHDYVHSDAARILRGGEKA